MATRWWRRWTLLYFTLLTAGTHWPRLSITVGEGPPPDKVLHLFAFGGLTLLLWQCRVISNKWLLGVVAAGWVLFDEWTQSLPILQRETSWEDVAAGLAGVACAIAWLWATAPLGGKLSRLRRMHFDHAVDLRLANFHGWLALGGRGLLYGSISAFMCCAFIDFFFLPRAKVVAAMIAFCLAFVFGVHHAFDAAAVRTLVRSRRFVTWLDGLAVGWLWSLGTILVAYFCAGVLIARGYDVLNVPESLQTVTALAIWLVVVTVLVRGARRHWASSREKRSTLCPTCGYDLSAHINDVRSSVCPECGTPFARLHNEPATGR